MELLVDAGANVQAQSTTNQTPRDISTTNFLQKIFPLLSMEQKNCIVRHIRELLMMLNKLLLKMAQKI